MGLCEGAVINVLFKNRNMPCFSSNYIPVRIVKEYPTYYLVEVMEHTNRYGMKECTAMYKMTIDKFDISVGNVAIA